MKQESLLTMLAWVWVAVVLVLYLQQFVKLVPHIVRALYAT